jgi:hypothetical protein
MRENAVCTKCQKYANEYAGLCGNCLLEAKIDPADHDPVLQHRRQLRAQQEKDGTFPKQELEAMQLSVMDRPPSVKLPGLRKLEEPAVSAPEVDSSGKEE